MEIRSPKNEAELEAVFDLCALAFSGTSRAYFSRSVRNDPDWEPWHTRVLCEGDRIVSTVQIFAREIAFHNGWIPCAGIGNVATHPAFRGRGLASSLLADTLRLVRQNGYAVSLLFTGIPGFYRRLGYRVLPTRRNILRWREGAVPGGRGVRAMAPGDWPYVRDLHENHARGCPVLVRRSAERWAALDKSAISYRPQWLVHDAQQGVDGYLRLDRIDDRWWVTEYGAPSEEILDALLDEAFRRSGASQILVDSLDREGLLAKSPFLAGSAQVGELMIAILDRDLLTRSLGLSQPEEVDEYVEHLSQQGVDMWRTDFF
ncbi:MAG: GNAT family N-acetyltransferase [candidate division KSB1 bacterium]|nr:GNAT family N-acetyltransferase [candidate division KSB1 bacterium]